MRRIMEHPTSWKDVEAATYDVISCDIAPSVDPCDVEGDPIQPDDEILLQDTQTAIDIWELAFGTDDHPNLDNAIAENFSPEGRAKLQSFVNGELFGNALSYIDNAHDLPSSGSYDWTSQAAQAKEFVTEPKDYGGGLDDFADPSPV